ncbi:AsmA family protein [Phreatobacter sp.]|uniref:AsmA family protein n=1 Tax=Phreatobacter sp. TaxID=1966341 RepID=UPI003F725F6E
MSLAAALKRVLTLVVVVVLALGATMALVPSLMPSEAVRQTVARELSGRLGLPVTIAGTVSVHVFPQLLVRLEDVRIGEGAPEDLPARAEALVGTLRLLPLLAGRVSVSDYVLVAPRVLIRVAEDGASNWDAAFASLRGLTGAKAVAFPDFRVVDGQTIIDERKTGRHLTVSGIDIAVSWPGSDRQATVSGSLQVNGEQLDISAVIARPIALLTAEPTAVKMRIVGLPLRAAFDGQVTNGAAVTAQGAMTVESTSLRLMLRWLGQNPGIGPSLGRFALKGEVQLLPQKLAFTKVNAELDGNTADGALTVSFEGDRPQVQGTLDAGRVVATTYFADLNLTPRPGQGWSRRPIDLSAVTHFDVDLRLSAREMIVGSANIGRTAAALTARNGRLAVTLGEAQAYGGNLRGALAVAPRGEGYEVKASLSVQRAQLGQGLGEWFGYRRIGGIANAQIAVEADGGSMADFVRTARGQASINAVEGSLRGFNAEAILRRLERRPLSSAGADSRAGTTPYERISATVVIEGGVARTADLVLEGRIVSIRLEGAAALASRELDLQGIASLRRSAPAEGAFDLPFVIQGSWDDPFVLPDPQSLIRRSRAAAPLRNVTRDRDALRAVLDAIQRHGHPDIGADIPPPLSFAPYPPLRPGD